MNDIPLIYTTKGNVLVSKLKYSHEWIQTNEEIIFSEKYTLDGEVVKRNVHVLKLKGETLDAEQTKT